MAETGFAFVGLKPQNAYTLFIRTNLQEQWSSDWPKTKNNLRTSSSWNFTESCNLSSQRAQ